MLHDADHTDDPHADPHDGPPKIRVRRMDLDAPSSIARWWFDNNPVLTHSVNALNALFPAGERFFVRSVRRYAGQIDDAALLREIRAFSAQEVHHGRAHDQMNVVLELQGYEIQSFLDWYERVAFGWIEPMAPPVIRLSVTVALEHLTATMAQDALTDGFLDHADPQVARLLRWHACEEIEHKAVAFDVLKKTDGRYVVRLAGMGIAVSLLLFFWTMGTRHLLKQERELTRARLAEERARARAMGIQRSRFLRGAFGAYLWPGFHPDDQDDRGLARDYLASIGRLAG